MLRSVRLPSVYAGNARRTNWTRMIYGRRDARKKENANTESPSRVLEFTGLLLRCNSRVVCIKQPRNVSFLYFRERYESMRSKVQTAFHSPLRRRS